MENRPTTNDDTEILELLNNLMHGLKYQLQQAFNQEQDGLTLLEARALRYLARNPESTQAELVQNFGRDKAQIARLISQLLERGLLQRQPDALDRRCHRLQLTEAGHALQQQVHRHRAALAARMLEGFEATEREVLVQMFARLQANLGETVVAQNLDG